MLSVRGMEKIFGGLRAVGGVSFEVAPKQIFGLIGPNGAGKTTVFNVITGVYSPDGGDILLDGKSIARKQPWQIALSGVGRTFQNIRLFSQMSVLENVLVAAHHRRKTGLFGALLRTRAQQEDERRLTERALELLKIFKLEGLAHEAAGSLPYGSQRRLEIARALMLDPKLILLDEPAAGMNSAEAEELKSQIRWLRDEFGLTIVLVEHNMQVVMGVCDHVHCVDHGETIATGTPEEIRRHPAVLAAYLGEEAPASSGGAS